MTMWRSLLVALLIFIVLVAKMPGCGRDAEPVTDEPVSPPTDQPGPEPEPSPAAQELSNQITGINPAEPGALRSLLETARDLDSARGTGTISEEEEKDLEEDLEKKFSGWVKERLDEIDPSDPGALKDFYDMQAVQATSEYDDYCDPATKQYKEEQMENKFNDWVRNRADELDPNDPDFLEKLEMLRIIQWTEKYEKLATSGTHRYKEEQLSDKFDEFVKNLVDKLNPLLPGFMQELGELVDLQISDVYQEFCSDEMKGYKTAQLYLKLAEEPGGFPSAIGTLPEHEETDVLLAQPLLLAFDQPMEPVSVMVAFDIDPAIEGDILWLEEDIIMLFQPLQSWDFDTTYTIYLGTEAMSQAGLLLEEGYKFNFTTKEPEEAPRVIETIPFNGQIDAPGSEPIEIHFDQSMEPASTEESIKISPATDSAVLWLEDNTIAVLQPLSPLESNMNYEVEIHASALSADMIPLAEGYSFSFITGIVRPPRVMGTFPENGQIDIPSNHPIQIVFDRSMDRASVEAALEVSPAMDYSTAWHEADFVLRIEPLAPLAANTTYTFKISTEATSAAGLPLVEIFSFSFATSEG